MNDWRSRLPAVKTKTVLFDGVSYIVRAPAGAHMMLIQQFERCGDLIDKAKQANDDAPDAALLVRFAEASAALVRAVWINEDGSRVVPDDAEALTVLIDQPIAFLTELANASIELLIADIDLGNSEAAPLNSPRIVSGSQ